MNLARHGCDAIRTDKPFPVTKDYSPGDCSPRTMTQSPHRATSRSLAHSTAKSFFACFLAVSLAAALNPVVGARLLTWGEPYNSDTIPNPGGARNFLPGQTNGKPMTEKNPYTSSIQIRSRFSTENFAPDGDLKKKVWQAAEWAQFDHDMSGRIAYPEALTKVASFWTATSVCFAFWCKYSTLNIYEGEDPTKERWELWNRDVAEVFINPQPERVNHYYEFEVAPNNQWIDLEIDKEKDPFADATWDSHFEHATQVDPQKHVWTCEMRIPVNAITNRDAIRRNTEWRINFFRADGPGDDSERRFLAWSTILEGKSFHVPTRFGIIRFVK